MINEFCNLVADDIDSNLFEYRLKIFIFHVLFQILYDKQTIY